jgi:hypothetical protein
MKIQAIPADTITRLRRTTHQSVTATARRTRGRARLTVLTTAVAVASIAGAAALAVTLPDPTHATTRPHRAAAAHGHAPSQHLTRPEVPPANGTGYPTHTTSGGS